MGNCASHKRTAAKNLSDFRSFMWNGRTREVMGRTAKSWVEILFFYLIFYSLLAAFWGALLFLRIKVLPQDTEGPLWTEYLTHRGPGLTIVPTGNDMKREVSFNKDDPESYKYYENKIEDFFNEYTMIDGEDARTKFTTCSDGQEGGSCSASDGYIEASTLDVVKSIQQGNETVNTTESHKLYNLLNLGDCESDYGYSSGEPCVFFTVNKVYEWVPDELSDERKEKHPELAEHETSEKFLTFFCQGFKSDDRENIESVTIYPKFGFQRDYFPWVSQEYFRQPVVAAKIKVTPEAMGKRIRVECKIYADNIHGDWREKPNIGRVEFSLKVSENRKENEHREETEEANEHNGEETPEGVNDGDETPETK